MTPAELRAHIRDPFLRRLLDAPEPTPETPEESAARRSGRGGKKSGKFRRFPLKNCPDVAYIRCVGMNDTTNRREAMTNKPRAKWIADRGVYAIDRVEATEVRVAYRHSTTGKPMTNEDGTPMTVPGTRIKAFAGEVAVLVCTIGSTHPMTLANYREVMARKIQDAGGSWLGRSHETEAAKAQALCDIMHNGAGDYTAAERKAIRDRHYNGMPHPSSY